MIAPLTATPASPAPDRLRQQAIELEGVFLNTLVSQMFESIDAKSGFGGGFAEETWRGMQAEQLSDAISQSGGFGLADAIVSNLMAVQQAAQALPPATGTGAY